MSTPIYAAWRHVFKLDPERDIDDETLDRICMSGTDAIIVGGSSGVTFDNTVDLMARIRRYEVDCALEVSSVEAAVPGFDWYFVPLVLNSSRVEWLVGHQISALKAMGQFVPWQQTSAQGYIILNPQATAAQVAAARTDLTLQDMQAYMYMADRLMNLPLVYIEYSGTFGDVTMVQQAQLTKQRAQIFYGGGITSAEQASRVAKFADTVVVGNVIYTDLQAALTTVEAVKGV